MNSSFDAREYIYHQGIGGSDEVWDRGTMFSQLAKRSSPGLVSGISKAAVCFLVISTLSLSISKEIHFAKPFGR